MLAIILTLIALLISAPVFIAIWGLFWGLFISSIGSLCLYLFFRIDERGRFIGILERWWPLGRSPRSFDPDQGELDPEEIEYIHNIRNESHETEIVITVGLFAGLVSIDVGAVNEWLWSLPFFLSPQTVGVIATALVISIWILRIGIFTHLLLRCIWIGIVGLGFSYPRGINRLHLVGPFQRRMYHHLTAPDTNVRLTLQMERLCSVLYAILMCSVFSILSWIFMVFICSFVGTYMALLLAPILSEIGLAVSHDKLFIVLALLVGTVLFGFWSYLRIGNRPFVRFIRQPLIEIFYFFKGTILTQNALAIPFAVAMPPLCLAIGVIKPVVSVEEQQAFVYADEVGGANGIELPHISSAIVSNSVIQLQLPTRTINIWQAHIAHNCATDTGAFSREKLEKLEEWAASSFGIWIDELPIGGVRWVREMPGESLRGFVELDGIENGFHTLYVDPCNTAKFRGGVSIPFYLDLDQP